MNTATVDTQEIVDKADAELLHKLVEGIRNQSRANLFVKLPTKDGTVLAWITVYDGLGLEVEPDSSVQD